MSNTPDETLKGLLETAKGARLSPAEEEQAFNLLKEAIASGKKGLSHAMEALEVFPWSLGVKAVAETWPALKPTTQRQFLAALNKLDSEPGKRMRLSIARGLFPLDQAVGIKLIVKFCSEMDCESARERQQFSNVLIGKTKPWVITLPLGELKPSEAHSLSKCVLIACQQAPAFTQVAIFSWLEAAGRLAKLSEDQLAAVAASVKRWQPRWQKELKKAVPNLPEPVQAAMDEAAKAAVAETAKAESAKTAVAGAASKPKQTPAPAPRQALPAKPKEPGQPPTAPIDIHIPYPGRPKAQRNQGQQGQQALKDSRKAAGPQTGEPGEKSTELPPAVATPGQQETGPAKESKPQPKVASGTSAPAAARQQKEQPRNQQRSAGSQGSQGLQGPQGGGFDLQRSLGEIHAFVNALKSENLQLKNQLRKRETPQSRERYPQREKSPPTLEELETLRRHNLQLEETIAHLRHDVEELISDHEDRASTLEQGDELKQFKTLLGFKLGKDYFDFEALRRESATEVVRRHLGDLLDHIFAVLKTEGVEFKETE